MSMRWPSSPWRTAGPSTPARRTVPSPAPHPVPRPGRRTWRPPPTTALVGAVSARFHRPLRLPIGKHRRTRLTCRKATGARYRPGQQPPPAFCPREPGPQKKPEPPQRQSPRGDQRLAVAQPFDSVCAKAPVDVGGRARPGQRHCMAAHTASQRAAATAARASAAPALGGGSAPAAPDRAGHLGLHAPGRAAGFGQGPCGAVCTGRAGAPPACGC